MARRSRMTTLQERKEIAERSAIGQTDAQIAQAMGISIATVRKWRRKQKDGKDPPVSRMGRPPTGPLSTFPVPVREAIRQMRQAHPGWGPQTIYLELEKDTDLREYPFPSPSRIAAFLKQEGLTRKYVRRSPLPQPNQGPPHRVHQEWEVDAQGAVPIPSLGKVSVIHVIDSFSRVIAASIAYPKVSHPSRKHYQQALRQAFICFGLPERVSVDHDTVFYDNVSSSPFPTQAHLWLIALGVEVRFITKPPPQEHSRIERLHQTMTRQALLGQTFANRASLQKALDERRQFLNERYPSRSLGGKAPLQAYPEARHTGRLYDPAQEEELLDMERVYRYLAQHCWFRRVSAQGQFSLGDQMYYLGREFARQEVEIRFDPQSRELICRTGDGQEKRLPIRGLTKADLMGESPLRFSMSAYQLPLPLPPVDQESRLIPPQGVL